MERILTIYPLYSEIRGLYSQLKNTIEKYTLPYFFGYYRGITYLPTMFGLNVHYPKAACTDFFCLIELQSALLCQNHIVLIKDFPAE